MKRLGSVTPTAPDVAVFTEGPTLHYTSVLNVVFVGLALILIGHFRRTGGPETLRMVDM